MNIFALMLPAGAGRGVAEASVHADHAGEVGPVARQCEHGQPAEAVTDGYTRIGHVGHGPQCLESGAHHVLQEQIWVIAHGA